MRNVLNDFIRVSLNVADLADKYKKSPYESEVGGLEVGYGCYAFSQVIRDGVQALVGLQMLNSSRAQQLEVRKSRMDDYEEFFEQVFGKDVDVGFFNEEERKRLHDAVKDTVAQIRSEVIGDADSD